MRIRFGAAEHLVDSVDQHARAWVDARSNELMWKEFEQRAAKNDFPEYKDSKGMGNMGATFVENGAYRKTAEKLKDGFLGPGYQKVDSRRPDWRAVGDLAQFSTVPRR